MKKIFGKYYLGLDCGTDSVGWAVTDEQYNILKFNGKAMWGIRLFEQAVPAADRRTIRCSRRRNMRKTQRIDLLQELFAEEIAKIDPTFFLRLNESRYHKEDKSEFQSNSLFNDSDYTDKDYYKEYPTIFHLRKALIKGVKEDGTPVKYDPRLVYLACHHILKNRGHFLFAGEGMKAMVSPEPLFEELKKQIEILFEYDDFSWAHDFSDIESALKQTKKSEKAESLQQLLSLPSNSSYLKILSRAISGYTYKFADLFANEELKEVETPSISFSDNSYEDKAANVQDFLDEEQYHLIEILKAIYDWSLLADIMGGYQYISESKVAQFNKNNKDLHSFKALMKEYCTYDEYEKFFHEKSEIGFSAYIGHTDQGESFKRCKAEDFNKLVKKYLDSMPEEAKATQEWKDIYDKAQNQMFFPLLISSNNSVLPHQIHEIELKEILLNSENYLAFLKVRDATGLTVSDKILRIFTFRIPYYVGPLTSFHNPETNENKYAWMTRRQEGLIRPWNFEDVIDVEKSAESFITRMTNKCTYLRDKDVIPKKSLLYSKYMVLNELNNLRLKGQKITVEQKQEIYNSLFKRFRKVTEKRIKDFVLCQGWYKKGEKIEISGVDGGFKSSLDSYLDFKEYLDNNILKNSDVESIIRWITLFGDDPVLLTKRIKSSYSEVLSDNQIKEIVTRFHYKDWGRLSKEFLTEFYHIDNESGECKSIITMLWETNDNLMILLGEKYNFKDSLPANERIGNLSYSIVENLYVSPAVKRQVWQILRIVQEIKKITGHDPEKVFFEFARERGEKGKRTKTRKQYLIELYQAQKKDPETQKLLDSLSNETDRRLQSDKLYLYYTQLGKCMYSGDRIDISNFNDYDIDHIYPRSKTKDDSLNNRVLVNKNLNLRKSDSYPLDDKIRTDAKVTSLWRGLLDKGLISLEKYERLIRHTKLTEEELLSFVNRQLVETRQSTKEAATVLKNYMPKPCQVVYSKAENVSEFRKKFDFIKCRSVNDYHHAKDAYLNIVVGNVYHTRFSGDFFKGFHTSYESLEADERYNVTEKIFNWEVKDAWVPGPEGTIKTVTTYMRKNNILFTRQTLVKKGQLFDLQLVSGDGKDGLLPSKPSDSKLKELVKEKGKAEAYKEWTTKYGGYNKLSVSYFILVRHIKKKKSVISLEPMLILYANFIKNKNDLIGYCVNELGLSNPEILMPKVRINTLIKVNGFPMYISGKSGDKIITKPAVQLCLSYNEEKYCKKIYEYEEKKKKFKNPNLSVDLSRDNISADENLALYKKLVSKAGTIYSLRPSNQGKVMREGEEAFVDLSVEEQCDLLSQILVYFSCTPATSDLSLIGGRSNAGFPVISKNLALGCDVVSQSVTGLFESIKHFE